MNNSPCSQEQPSPELSEAIESINQRKLANPIIALGLAALYADSGKNDEAIEIIEKLVTSGIQTAEILFALGEVYEAVNSNQQAKQKYNKAIEISSQVIEAAKAGLERVEDTLGDGVATDSLHQETRVKFMALADRDKFLFLTAARGCGSCTCDDGRPGYKVFGICLPCGG